MANIKKQATPAATRAVKRPKTAKQPVRTASKRGTPLPVRRLATKARVWYKPGSWRRPKPSYTPLPKARMLLSQSLKRLSGAKKAVAGVTAVYGLGVILLVRGFSASQDLQTLQTLLDGLLQGAGGKLQSIALQLTFLFGGGGNENTLPNASLYQTILLIICSLALIWVFRQKQAKQPVSTKRAFYNGMYPLIPFSLVILIIGLQLLPLTIGSYIYTTLIGNGIVVHQWEKLLTLGFFVLSAFWSLRMVTSSIFALYIVTLGDMTPLKAVRSAKLLVKGRRLLIWRKIILLPVVMLIGSTLVVLPFLLFLTPFAVWVFFLLSTAWFALIHSYLYSLYRELLNHA
ncbi:hypothetical protein IPL85_04900 [Candidatus Saccharibacteria bacterium]|nr:MAG: hypothetical protein IPL85_04900 [Candidatus Saccharibacteria bacterium]